VKSFKINKVRIGAGRCFVVADVAQAHDGSLGAAHAFVDAVAKAGADAIKFQTHIAAAESTAREPFRVKFSLQDKTRYHYWKRMEFTKEQWKGLAKHAREAGLIFLSSPFSVEAVDLLQRTGMPAWKIGSGEVTNEVLLNRIIRTRKPILLSSGMSTWKELDAAVARIKRAGVPFMIYQCTTKYPCPPEDVGLGLLAIMKKKYGVPVGLSDHSGRTCFGIAAAALGADSVEVHIAMSRDSFGPDVPASLIPAELAELVQGIRMVEAGLNSRPDKNMLANKMKDIRVMFGRSVVTRVPVKNGTVLTAGLLTVKKPGGGLPPSALKRLIGKTVTRNLAADWPISRRDVKNG
jgi:N,N'-diacetyllegionaminate synthase